MLMIFAVTFALIILSQIFLFKKNPAQPPKPTENKTAPTNQTAAQSAAPSQSPSQPASQPNATAAQSTAAKAARSEALTVVENDVYRVTFTNKGALVKSWVLKKYKDDEGKRLDLVNQQAAE